jgi:hypothetical protein
MSKTQLILLIIQTALAGLAAVPGGAVLSAEGMAFVKILQAGVSAYQAETGQPLDLTKIPLETPIA